MIPKLRHVVRRVQISWLNARYFVVTRYRFDPKVHLPAVGWAALAFIVFLSIAVTDFSQRGLADNTGQYAASSVIGELNAAAGSSFAAPTNQYGMGGNGVIVDTANHRLFVDDGSNSRILIYSLNASNQLTSNTPNYVLGWPDLTTNQYSEYGTQPTTQSSIANSTGIAYDPTSQDLFVTDQSEDRVLVFDLSGAISNNMNATYELGEPDFTTDANTDLCNTGSVSSTTLRDPMALAYDSANKRLFVADGCDNRVVVYDFSTGISDGMAASNVLGEPNLSTWSGGTTQTTMKAATGVEYDQADQLLFVSDGSIVNSATGNNRVLVYDLSTGISDGMAASNVLGQSLYTTSTAALTATGMESPEGLRYDPTSKQLFVADTGNNRVLDFNLTSGISDGMAASKVLGEPNFTTTNTINNPTVSQSQLYLPGDVSYDAVDKILYVADTGNSRIMVYDLSGGIADGMNASNVLGQTDLNGNPTYTSGIFNDYNHFLNQYVSGPLGTAVDTVHHRLFVSDNGDDRIMIYGLDANDNFTNPVAINVLGQPDFTTVMGSNATIAQNTIGCPGNVAYDSSRNYLFVDDACANRVLVYDLSNGITDGMNASFVLGQLTFGGSGSNTSQNGLNDPLLGGLAIDTNTHYLYVGDDRNDRVMVFDTTNLADGMNAAYEIGQVGFGTNVASVSQAGLSTPIGVAVDSQHHELFVADSGQAGRVMVYDTSNLSSGMLASNVLGETAFNVHNSAADTNGTPDANSFTPGGLAYDPNNQRLFVEDDFGNRVLGFDLAGGISNDMAASSVIGEPDFATSTSPILINKYNFLYPDGGSEAYDTASNQLYVSDVFNSRVLEYSIANLAPVNSSPTVGTVYNQVLGSQAQGATTYSFVSGTLPPGLTFDTATSTLAGTVTTAGTYNFNLAVSDNNGPDGIFSDARSYAITVNTSGGGSSGGGGGSTGGTSGGTSGNSSGSSGSSQRSTTTTASTPSNPVTTVTTPSGLQVVINLVNGQTIPLGGYIVTATPKTEPDVSLQRVDVYDDGQLVNTMTPDQTNVARWDWQPSTAGPADLKFVITDSLGRQTTQLFSVSVTVPPAEVVQRTTTVTPVTSKHGGGILDGLIRFVGSLPNAVVRYFPFFLLILLIIDALILFQRVLHEYSEWRVQKKLLAQAQDINKLKTTFVQLASHYLRTPLTIMKGGVELLAANKASAKLASQLSAAADGIAGSIEPLIQDASTSMSNPESVFVRSNAPKRYILLQPVVLVPIVLIGAICLLFDYLVKSAGKFSMSTDAFIEQAILFSIGVLLIYSAYRYLSLTRRDNKEMKRILQSEIELGESKDRLIATAADVLDDKLAQFNVLVSGITNPAAQRIIQGGSDRLTDIVHKFHVAKTLRGIHSDVIDSDMRLSELIKPVEADLQNELSKNGMSLKVDADKAILRVSEVELLRYVLESLVSNAIAYKRDSGNGTVTVIAKGDKLLVSDDGVGIPKEKLPQLFQPFFKVEGAESFNHEGMGFSLFLDKLIMNYLQGNILVSSVQGEGTTVTVVLR